MNWKGNIECEFLINKDRTLCLSRHKLRISSKKYLSIPLNLILLINLFFKSKRMKKTVLIVYLLSIVSMGFAQIQLKDCYSVNIGNALVCNIDFYSNGTYELSISEEIVPNAKTITILSIGRYTVKKNLISLYDSCTGFQIQCERKSDKLKIIRGFPFMSQLILNSYGSTYDAKDIQRNIEKMQDERDKYKQAHPDKYPLYYNFSP